MSIITRARVFQGLLEGTAKLILTNALWNRAPKADASTESTHTRACVTLGTLDMTATSRSTNVTPHHARMVECVMISLLIITARAQLASMGSPVRDHVPRVVSVSIVLARVTVPIMNRAVP